MKTANCSGSTAYGAKANILFSDETGAGKQFAGGSYITTNTDWSLYSVILSAGSTSVFGNVDVLLMGHGDAATFTGDAWFDNISVIDLTGEAILINEAITRAISDSEVSSIDNIITNEDILRTLESNVDLTDTIIIDESINQLLDAFISQYEDLTISEDINQILIANISVSDTTSITENLTTLLENVISAYESISISEDIIREINNFVSIDDSVSISEYVKPDLQIKISIIDNSTITDINTVAPIILNTNLVDLISLDEGVHTMIIEVSDPNVIVSDVISIDENFEILKMERYIYRRKRPNEYTNKNDIYSKKITIYTNKNSAY